ncbi:MAG: hypothetical protein GXY25_11715 [Pirellulaceae bacterium]|nr:hypothetical protein [Thermoguttaceae bacterium]MDI9443066.1 hypothetical protein [Planctomycetota bacterium]NLZ01195.1 hypothetical protein [Pirellulaceae bacterium]
MVPPCCEDGLSQAWLDAAGTAAAVVIRGCSTREEIVAEALGRLELPAGDAELAGDFLALGYCHLIVELLTRQLRYMSNLDEVSFRRNTLAAAEKWLEGDSQTAASQLTSAFDLLTEAREYFYPVETHLLDLTLVAPTTIGPALRDEIARAAAVNLVLTGETLEAMAQNAPETLATLRLAVEQGRVSLAGGEFAELESPLLGPEATLAQFRRGRETFERLLGRAPEIFCRRRFGLSPLLPQILRSSGYQGVCHFTLDDGRFPSSNQSKIRWEGIGAQSIDALVRLPCDASRAGTFLALPQRLGNAMDLDHAATAVFAHWPGMACPWYRDLLRAGSYSAALGRFVLMDSYFKETRYVGQAARHAIDTYRPPFLRQAVDRNDPAPLSRWVGEARAEIARHIEASLRTMAAMIAGGPVAETSPENVGEHLGRLRRALGPAAAASPHGCLVVNPFSFARKVHVEVSDWPRLPATGGLVWAAAEQDGSKHLIVDVPPMGFAWVDPDTPAPAPDPPGRKGRLRLWRKKSAAPPPMAEPCVLRNEFFEIKLDPASAAIRSIHDYRSRDNRLACQLAFRRDPARRIHSDDWDDDPDTLYSVMAADAIEVRSSGPLTAELFARGRLLDHEGQRVARFEQVLRARRGSRVLAIDLEIQPERIPEGDPWTTYYAARFAWSDASADLFGGLGTASLARESPQIEAPYYLDIRSEPLRTTILTGGLPYHRRLGLRKLDTLLIVAGETRRKFQLGVGIDLPHAYPAAMERLAPETVVRNAGAAPGNRTGWLFHLSAKNVVATAWEPIFRADRVEGVRVRLAENENRAVETVLRCFRPVAAARKVDFLGGNAKQLAIDGDRVRLQIGGHQWLQVEIEFAP